MGIYGRDFVCIKVDRSVGAVFLLDAFHDFVPQGCGRSGGASQERLITFIGGVVLLDKVTYIDFGLPIAGNKAFPCACKQLSFLGHSTHTF